MKSKLFNSLCQTPRLKCTEDKNPISSMTQKMSLAKKMKQQTLDFRYLWSSYTSPGLRAVMSNGAPLHSTKLVKIISKVAFWRDKSYFVTLFWDEVVILWDKNLFSIDGDLRRPLGQNLGKLISLVKFIYSEKATKFCKTSTVDLTVTT